jgi:hypothetical protein
MTFSHEFYFPFKEAVIEMISMLLGDGRIIKNAVVPLPQLDEPGMMPSSGFVPVHSVPLLMAPFSFVTTRLEEAYLLFVGFFCLYAAPLISVSNHGMGMKSILSKFLNGWKAGDCGEIGEDELSLASHLAQTCFFNLLEVSDALKLLDIILIFDDTSVLVPVLHGLFWKFKDRLDVLEDYERNKFVPENLISLEELFEEAETFYVSIEK